MSFPPATEMFQFTGFASRPYGFRPGYPCGWVAPFGDPGIKERSPLPPAFRSVPRPSSPLSAKASTRCPSHALDRLVSSQLSLAPAHAIVPHARGARVKTLYPKAIRSAAAAIAAPERTASVTHTLPLHPVKQHALRRPNHTGPAASWDLPDRCRGQLAATVVVVVEVNGIEPMTSCLQSRRSPN